MADTIQFTVADIPEDSIPSDTTPSDNGDLACEVCGKPLVYAGRGRKPRFCEDHRKSGSSSGSAGMRARRSNRDVEAAMAALDAAHTGLTFGLMLVSPTAASMWEEGRPSLNARNQTILEGDPALAKRLANMAAKGGTGALIISHLVAVVPVLGVARQDMRLRRAERMAANASEEEYADTSFDMADAS